MGHRGGKSAGDPILAAGGLVWRSGPEAATLAVVYRPKYKDWVIPKGKLKPRETALVAACREAQEETGCQVTVDGFIGSFAYDVSGRRKVVHVWRMEAGNPVESLHSDVSQVLWLTPDAAVEKLSHELERDFIRSATAQAAEQTRRLGFLRRFFDTSTARLAQAVAVYETECNSRLMDGEAKNERWAKTMRSLLTRVRSAINEQDPEVGWHCFKAATRIELYGLPKEELSMRATRLLSEAYGKLESWRKDAIQKIERSEKGGALPPHKIAAIARILHDHEDNRYKVLRIRWRQFAALGLCALLFLVIVAALMPATKLDLDVLRPWGALQIAAVGALGAAISGILRIGSGTGARRIPDELGGFGFLVARLAVGAGAAVFLVALSQSGFLKIDNVNKPAFLIAIAFVAGFSERLAQNAIEKLADAAARDPRAPGPKSSR